MTIVSTGPSVDRNWMLAKKAIPPDINDAAALVNYMAPRMDKTFRMVTEPTEELRYDELVDRDPLASWGRAA